MDYIAQAAQLCGDLEKWVGMVRRKAKREGDICLYIVYMIYRV